MSESLRPLYGTGSLVGSVLCEALMTTSDSATSAPTPTRVFAFDWLRGLAVLVMIQTHALVLLRLELHADAGFRWLQRLDGLVAPSFIFSAGFALALVQVRAARAQAGLPARLFMAKKSLRRIGEVLLVAALVNTIWFHAWRAPRWLLRVDILQCIALSLLLALPVVVALAHRPWVLRWVLLGLALLIFGVSPLAETVTGIFSLVLNTRPGVLDDTLGSPFPLLPWSGYVFLGASFGATVGALEREAQLWRWLGLLGALGAALWAFEDFFRQLYPPHDFWVTNPANAAQRWTLVLGLVSLLRVLEVRWPSATGSRAATLLGGLGASSLSAYFFHEMLLFEHHVGVFKKLFGERCSWALFWPVLLALIGLTWACVKLWERLAPRLAAAVRATTASARRPRAAS
jgi:uncharacterized membrane protein